MELNIAFAIIFPFETIRLVRRLRAGTEFENVSRVAIKNIFGRFKDFKLGLAPPKLAMSK